MDVCRLGYADASFDAVVAQFLITLVPDPEAALDEFLRVVRPGGEIVLANHFGQNAGPLAKVEEIVAPLCTKIGWSLRLQGRRGSRPGPARNGVEFIGAVADLPGRVLQDPADAQARVSAPRAVRPDGSAGRGCGACAAAGRSCSSSAPPWPCWPPAPRTSSASTGCSPRGPGCNAWVAEDRFRAMVVAYLVYVGAVVVSVPASLFLTMLCGFLFGIVPGALVAVASATTGAAIVFTIGRGPAADLLLRRAGPRLAGLAAGFREDAFGYIAFLRLLPIFPFWMTNLAPAAFGVKLRHLRAGDPGGAPAGRLRVRRHRRGDRGRGRRRTRPPRPPASPRATGSIATNALTLRALSRPRWCAGLGASRRLRPDLGIRSAVASRRDAG